MRFFLAAAVFTTAIIGLAEFVLASDGARHCNLRENTLRTFAERFNEAPVAIGLTTNGQVIEILSTPNGSTWSAFLTNPNGMTCMIGSGTSWNIIEWMAPKNDS